MADRPMRHGAICLTAAVLALGAAVVALLGRREVKFETNNGLLGWTEESAPHPRKREHAPPATLRVGERSQARRRPVELQTGRGLSELAVERPSGTVDDTDLSVKESSTVDEFRERQLLNTIDHYIVKKSPSFPNKVFQVFAPSLSCKDLAFVGDAWTSGKYICNLAHRRNCTVVAVYISGEDAEHDSFTIELEKQCTIYRIVFPVAGCGLTLAGHLPAAPLPAGIRQCFASARADAAAIAARVLSQWPAVAHVDVLRVSVGGAEPELIERVLGKKLSVFQIVVDFNGIAQPSVTASHTRAIARALSTLISKSFRVFHFDFHWAHPDIGEYSLVNPEWLEPAPSGIPSVGLAMKFSKDSRSALWGAAKAARAGPSVAQRIYSPNWICPNEDRLGHPLDGGKWLCGVAHLKQKEKCVVWSVGSAGESSFERALHGALPKCEVHTFDPGDYAARMPPFVHYHQYGLAVKRQPSMKTLEEAVSELSVSHIDILKFDIEGFEHAFVPAVWCSGRAPAVTVGQLLFEFHPTLEADHTTTSPAWFECLISAGFRPFHVEANFLHPILAEWAFVNVSLSW